MELPDELRTRFDAIFQEPTYSNIQGIRGKDFTWFIYYLFERDNHYRPTFNDGKDDHQLDILLHALDPNQPYLEGIVQCKGKENEDVGRPEMVLFIAESKKFRASRRYYFTNNDFTIPARTEAQKSGIFLFTTNLIRQWILDMQQHIIDIPPKLHPLRIPVISVINYKGGVGKTTLVASMAAALGKLQKRVLVIDTDQSGNLTSWILGKNSTRSPQRTLYGVLHDNVPIYACIETSTLFPNVFVLPSHNDLRKLKSQNDYPAERILPYALIRFPISEFQLDYILIDTPPSANSFTTSAIAASQYIILPFKLEQFSYDGSQLLLTSIKEAEEKHDTSPKILGAVAMVVKTRDKVSNVMRKSIPQHALTHPRLIKDLQTADQFWIGETRERADYEQAKVKGISIFDIGNQQAIDDIAKITTEVIKRVNLNVSRGS